jgi:hypothetical protein
VNITEAEYFKIINEYKGLFVGDSYMHHAARLGHLSVIKYMI